MDAKAKKILFSTYWKNGWIDDKLRHIDKEDFEYAKSKGLMFDPFSIKHDACVREVRRLVGEIPRRRAAAAFISSLSSRRLDWRSALFSRIIAERVSAHRYKKIISGTFYRDGKPIGHSYTCGGCKDCGVTGSEKYIDEDLSVLNFERLKWGGVRQSYIIYQMFDLTQFAADEVPEPTRDDVLILKKILAFIEKSPPAEKAGQLQKRLADAVDGSDSERKSLIELFAAIGVLRPTADVEAEDDVENWEDCANMWRGKDRYCRKTVEELFGEYL